MNEQQQTIELGPFILRANSTMSMSTAPLTKDMRVAVAIVKADCPVRVIDVCAWVDEECTKLVPWRKPVTICKNARLALVDRLVPKGAILQINVSTTTETFVSARFETRAA
jgi:hypothetical protein